MESAIFLFTRRVLAFFRVTPAKSLINPIFLIRSACFDQSSGQPRVNPGKQEGGGPQKKSKNRRVFFSRYLAANDGGINPEGWLTRATLLLTQTYILAFTIYSITSRLLCTNQPSLHSPRPPALPTLVQHYCTSIGQYTTPLPTSRWYAIHYTILVITISCKGQLT